VALVEGEEIFELDLADAMSATMPIDGVIANESASFKRYSISPTDKTKAPIVVKKLLLEQKPDVIISAAGDEFIATVMYSVEQGWQTTNPGQPPPFYVLSMENRYSQQLIEMVKANATKQLSNESDRLQRRILGVNYASAKDITLKEAYL